MDKGIPFCLTSKTTTTLLINYTQYEVKCKKKEDQATYFLKKKRTMPRLFVNFSKKRKNNHAFVNRYTGCCSMQTVLCKHSCRFCIYDYRTNNSYTSLFIKKKTEVNGRNKYRQLKLKFIIKSTKKPWPNSIINNS